MMTRNTRSQQMSPAKRKSAGSLAAAAASVIARAEKAGPAKAFAVSLALTAIVTYFAFGYLISPLSGELNARRQALSTLRAQNEAARRIEATYPEFIGQFKRAWADYQTATQLLPEEVEVSGVLSAVQQLAEREGVKVTLFNAVKEGGKSPVADRLQERVVPAQVVGGHKAVTRFLTQVASFPRIIHVREIAVTGLKGGESADLVIAAYYAPPPGSLPPVPSGVRDGR